MIELLKNFFIYGIGGILSKLIGFLLLPIFTSKLSPEEYGYYDLIISISTIVAIGGMLQLDAGFQQFYFKKKTDAEKVNLTSTVFSTILTLSIFVVTIFLVFVPNISELFFNGGYINELYLSSIEILCCNLLTFLFVVLRFENRPKTYSVLVLINSILYALISIVLVVIYNFRVLGILVGTIFSELFIILIILFLERTRIKFYFNTKIIKEVSQYALPIIPARIGSVANIYMNRFIMVSMFSAGMLGLYSLGVRIASIVYLIYSAFQLSWLPYLYKELNNPNHKDKIIKVFRHCTMIICLFVCIISLFAKEIVILISKEQYIGAASIIGILCLYNGLILIKETTEIGMKVTGKSASITYVYFVSLFVNLLGLYIFPKFLGIIGIALSLLMSNIVMVYLTVLFSNKLYKINYPMIWFTSLLILTILISILSSIYDFTFHIKFFVAIIALILYIITNRTFLKNITLKVLYKKI